MTSFIPSEHQKAFFEELVSGSSSILLEAVAGSGKTTTIVHGTTLLPPGYLTIFLAFNKKIAEELESRLPSSIQCGTFHSRCFRALQRALPSRPTLNKDKVRDLLKENLKWSEFELYGQYCQKLISLAKSAGLGTEIAGCEATDFSDLISRFALTLDSADADPDRALNIARACFEESNSITKTIDFDDMIYLALLRNVTFDKAAYLFADEVQDFNRVFIHLSKRMLTPDSGRFIGVGDPHQSIYGFRGADASAMDFLAEQFSCKRLPLSVSYRCSKAVVKEAQKYL